MTEIIDVHSHLLNFKFIPDSFFRTRAPFREKLLRRWFFKPLYYIIAALPWRRYTRLPEYQRIMNQDILEVAKIMIDEMDTAGIQLAIPLMMDLKVASFGEMAETPYAVQVIWLSEIALKYPARIMPFIMFDPRREGAADLVKRALDELGFLGVKMYPPLGYHPDPESIAASSRCPLPLIVRGAWRTAAPLCATWSPFLCSPVLTSGSGWSTSFQVCG